MEITTEIFNSEEPCAVAMMLIPFLTKHGKQFSRYARTLAHSLAHDGDDRHIFFNRDAVDVAAGHFGFEGFFQNGLSAFGVAWVDGEADRMLRRSLRNQDHADLIVRQGGEKPGRNARHADHPAALNIDQRHVVDGRNARDGVFLVVGRAVDEGTLKIGIEGIENFQRNILGKSRLQAGRINDLGPKVRQLHGLGVRNGRES